MALPKIEEARNLNDEELADAIISAKKELFDLRFKRATGQLEKTHEFKHVKHKIAQLLTVERERELQKAAPSAAPTATAE
ncbi:MAG: 50S ribosomal protein L29 [Jaaginema sp. PMC 1079.18]|nr:50S ribosomal protein L29 [Jaaginema sp. PMC 1080.18]MEC4850214.1 50S ribosomal protein L29 [Jaaginema sp. PMC 1079.18]MEC4865901.1 50S ribosomal protein L29 [Jaaginema sp. PMC 1078.18]